MGKRGESGRGLKGGGSSVGVNWVRPPTASHPSSLLGGAPHTLPLGLGGGSGGLRTKPAIPPRPPSGTRFSVPCPRLYQDLTHKTPAPIPPLPSRRPAAVCTLPLLPTLSPPPARCRTSSHPLAPSRPCCRTSSHAQHDVAALHHLAHTRRGHRAPVHADVPAR